MTTTPPPEMTSAREGDGPIRLADEPALVLIVDDNHDHRELLRVILERSGYRTRAAADGKEGLRAARLEQPDLIISDIMMPEDNGISMCAKIRADEGLRSIPILLVSALRKDTDVVVSALAAGADDFMESPFEPLRLIAWVERFLERHRAEAAQRDSLQLVVEERTRQLEDANRRLEDANRELQMFSYGVSHDLRAPLDSVCNYLRAISELTEGSLDETSSRLLRLAEARLTHTAQMMSRLLDFSCAGHAEMRRDDVCFGAVARAAVEALRAETGGREVRWRIGPLPRARGDHSLLELAARNLLSNALKYTRRCETAEIEIGGEERDGEAILYVRDNGVGFDPGRAGDLFDLFQRLHEDGEFEGTGIGLASVRRIVERHGGRVWAEGRPGEGATFYFALPLGPDPTQPHG